MLIDLRGPSVSQRLMAEVDRVVCLFQPALFAAGLTTQVTGPTWVATWPASCALGCEDLADALCQGIAVKLASVAAFTSQPEVAADA